MSDATYIYHPMVARAINAYLRTPNNFGDSIARQLSSLIGPLHSTSTREDELRNIYVAVQFSVLPKKFAPALQELSLQIVRLLGGIAQLKAVATLQSR